MIEDLPINSILPNSFYSDGRQMSVPRRLDRMMHCYATLGLLFANKLQAEIYVFILFSTLNEKIYDEIVPPFNHSS